MFVQKHSFCYVHLVVGIIFLALPEGLVQRHLSFPQPSSCVPAQDISWPDAAYFGNPRFPSLPATCPASPKAHASPSARATAFADAPARVARAVPTRFQASCCGLFLAVPTAPLEELGLVYDILSVWADPGRVSDPGHVSHPRHVSFPGRAAPGWPLCATHPSLSTGNLQSQCGFFIIIFGAKGDRYVYLLSFLELRVTSMSFIIIFGVKGDRYAFLLL